MRADGRYVVYGLGVVAVALMAAAVVFRPAVNRAGVPKPDAGGVAAAPAGPSARPGVTVEVLPERAPTPDTEYRVWTLQAAGLKRLTARLLLAANGKAEPLTDVEYRWDRWPADAPAAAGHLVLLIQDGEPFGAKGRRRAVLDLDLRGSPDHARSARTSARTIDGDLRPFMTSASLGNPLGPRTALFGRLYTPPGAPFTGSVSLGSDPESVAAAAKDGRTVLAVELGWEPRGN